MTANGVYSVLNVPRKAAAFPLWRAIESRWNKNMDSLGSSVTAVIRRPIFWTNSMARWFHAPAVSIATGKKMWVFASSPYLAILLTAALLAAAAGSVAVSPMCESANVLLLLMMQKHSIHCSQNNITVGQQGTSLALTVARRHY